MAVTSTFTNSNGVSNVAVGAYIDTGTAAAFTITCGFKPRYVRIVNETDPGTLEWFEGMADAEGFKHVDGTMTMLTSLGITPTTHGFNVGLDTDINVTSQQLSWIAIG